MRPQSAVRASGVGIVAMASNRAIGLLVLVVAIPLMGYLSDKWGRKPLLLACCIAFIVVPYPFFSFLLGGASYTQLILVQIVFAILIGITLILQGIGTFVVGVALRRL